MEISSLSDAEFKTLIVRMLKELRGKADELRENFNSLQKDKKTIRKKAVRYEGYTD